MGKPTDPLVEQLKPCPNPWCSKSSPRMLSARGVRLGPDRFQVCCDHCEVSAPCRNTEAEAIAAWNARFDNDRTAMLVEALAPFSHAADLADGAMLGRYGKAELPDDTTVLGALKLTLGDIRRARDAVRVQESHGGERYPDIQRLQLGKQED